MFIFIYFKYLIIQYFTVKNYDEVIDNNFICIEKQDLCILYFL